MMQPSMSRCPDEETLAAWVEGRLSIDETAKLIEHASVCEECIAMIDAANETFHAEAATTATAGMGWQRWFLAVAAVLVVAFAAIIGLRLRSHDPIQDLVSVAPRSARAVEARLSGGFPWAPYRGAMRANGAAADTGQMKLIGTAAEALERAQRDPSPDAQHAAALALVLIDRPEEGTARLTVEVKQSPNDARVWSDLGAAQYAAALTGRTALYPEALASVDRALGIDPRSLEALFNRALILERLGLRSQARTAWQRYLENDSSSQWAVEAREHLARLAAKLEAPRFETDRPILEAAAAAGDDAATRTLVDRQRERARAYAEAEYLGRWADALKQSKPEEAAKWLTISRNIGAALVSVSGESLLHDAVQAIDTADPAKRLRIAEAHLTYRKGRIAYSRRELSSGERDLRLAADQFAAAGDPMSLAARSYAAGARLAQNDVVQARRELSALMTEVDAAHGYLSLAGQVRWELGRGLMFDDDWTGAARVLAEAESLFGRAGESVNQAMVGTMLADALIALGRPDEAWSAHIRAFETFAAAGRLDLLDTAVGGAATSALRSGKTETARALVDIGESLERQMSNDQLLADTLVRKSLLDTPIDAEAAVRSAGEAASVRRVALRWRRHSTSRRKRSSRLSKRFSVSGRGSVLSVSLSPPILTISPSRCRRQCRSLASTSGRTSSSIRFRAFKGARSETAAPASAACRRSSPLAPATRWRRSAARSANGSAAMAGRTSASCRCSSSPAAARASDRLVTYPAAPRSRLSRPRTNRSLRSSVPRVTGVIGPKE